jgi:HSP20 family protein
MKTLTRWNPFREVAPFAAFPDMDPFFAEWPLRTMMERYEPAPMMRMDVVEDAKGYMLTAELPGRKKEDIAVSIDGNNVSINAEAKCEKEVKGEGKEEAKALRSERYYGSVSRTVTLPSDVDATKSEAIYENGVLTLVLPKAAGVEAKQLVIH